MGMTNEGLTKVIEEAGETITELSHLITECAKSIACPTDEHWDGKGSLKQRLENEIADTLAALRFTMAKRRLDSYAIYQRAETKLALFIEWDKFDA